MKWLNPDRFHFVVLESKQMLPPDFIGIPAHSGLKCGMSDQRELEQLRRVVRLNPDEPDPSVATCPCDACKRYRELLRQTGNEATENTRGER